MTPERLKNDQYIGNKKISYGIFKISCLSVRNQIKSVLEFASGFVAYCNYFSLVKIIRNHVDGNVYKE